MGPHTCRKLEQPSVHCFLNILKEGRRVCILVMADMQIIYNSKPKVEQFNCCDMESVQNGSHDGEQFMVQCYVHFIGQCTRFGAICSETVQ